MDRTIFRQMIGNFKSHSARVEFVSGQANLVKPPIDAIFLASLLRSELSNLGSSYKMDLIRLFRLRVKSFAELLLFVQVISSISYKVDVMKMFRHLVTTMDDVRQLMEMVSSSSYKFDVMKTFTNAIGNVANLIKLFPYLENDSYRMDAVKHYKPNFNWTHIALLIRSFNGHAHRMDLIKILRNVKSPAGTVLTLNGALELLTFFNNDNHRFELIDLFGSQLRALTDVSAIIEVLENGRSIQRFLNKYPTKTAQIDFEILMLSLNSDDDRLMVAREYLKHRNISSNVWGIETFKSSDKALKCLKMFNVCDQFIEGSHLTNILGSCDDSNRIDMLVSFGKRMKIRGLYSIPTLFKDVSEFVRALKYLVAHERIELVLPDDRISLREKCRTDAKEWYDVMSVMLECANSIDDIGNPDELGGNLELLGGYARKFAQKCRTKFSDLSSHPSLIALLETPDDDSDNSDDFDFDSDSSDLSSETSDDDFDDFDDFDESDCSDMGDLEKWKPDELGDIYVDITDIDIEMQMTSLMGINASGFMMTGTSYPDNIAIYNVETKILRSTNGALRQRGMMLINNIDVYAAVDNIIKTTAARGYSKYLKALEKKEEKKKNQISREWKDEKTRDDDPEGTACVICMSRKRQIMFNCGHYHTCFKCSKKILKSTCECPICRVKIETVTRVFG